VGKLQKKKQKWMQARERNKWKIETRQQQLANLGQFI